MLDKLLEEERILEEDMGIEYDPNISITSNSTVLSATDSVITSVSANSCVLFVNNTDTTIKDQKKYQPKVSQISSIASIFLMVKFISFFCS